MARPYQPSLLRLLHGATAALVALAWISGGLIVGTLDRRWGRLPIQLPAALEVIDLHGSLGVALTLISFLFVPYALTLGRARLRRPENGVALLALLLALVSGKLMDEDWLREGQLHHLAYSLHLTAWLVLSLAVVVHLLVLLRRGGPALPLSMLRLDLKPGDQPRHWPQQLRRFFGFP
jgi:hypothetical protein